MFLFFAIKKKKKKAFSQEFLVCLNANLRLATQFAHPIVCHSFNIIHLTLYLSYLSVLRPFLSSLVSLKLKKMGLPVSFQLTVLVAFVCFNGVLSFYVDKALFTSVPEENWGRNVYYGPQFFHQPETEQEIIQIVKDTAARGGKIKVSHMHWAFLSPISPTSLQQLISSPFQGIGRSSQLDANRCYTRCVDQFG